MSASPPVVTVVIASHNAARYLRAAVGSALGQTLHDLEVIVVDDGSTDDTEGLVAQLAVADGRLRYIRLQTQRGPSAARNAGISQARGAFVAILDADDVMRSGRLERLGAFARSEGADLVADNLGVFHAYEPMRPRWMRDTRYAAAGMGLADYLDGNHFYRRDQNLGPLKPLIRRGFLADSGVRYDERLAIGEDFALVAECLAKGARFCIAPQADYFYRKHAGSTSHRMTPGQVRDLMAFAAGLEHMGLDDDAGRALGRYRASLDRALAYGLLVEALKTGDVAVAGRLIASRPDSLALLSRPVERRLRLVLSKLARRFRDSRLQQARDAELEALGALADDTRPRDVHPDPPA